MSKTAEVKPKKLIRKYITNKLKEGEWEIISNQDELNKLYSIKVREELAEIQASDHRDIMEFVDLIQVAFSFAKQNGFTHEQLSVALIEKSVEKGSFSNLALNNLNPANPSNKLYFEAFAAPPPASEGEMAKEMIEACKIALHTLDSIDFTRLPGTASKRLQSVIDKYATLPIREPEAKEKFAVRFSEWLMIQCDYKNHCVWEYQGEEYTQQELIEIFKRMTPSLPTQSITN